MQSWLKIGWYVPGSVNLEMDNQKREHNGFTLIELLVVIAIIAMLLTIVMPSLARVRRQAESVYCLNNLRQMMIAAVSYTHNHNGLFPVSYYSRMADDCQIHYNWDFTVKRTADSTEVKPGILWQSDAIDAIHQCPSFQGDSNTPYDPYTGYNYNTSYIGRGQWESIQTPARIEQLRNSPGTAVFGDGQTLNGANKFMRSPLRSEGDMSFSGRYAGAQGFRHNQQTNVAWADGSAGSQSEVFINIEPARHQQVLDDYNQQNPHAPIGFLSSGNSAYNGR